jgi:hypothetical protein
MQGLILRGKEGERGSGGRMGELDSVVAIRLVRLILKRAVERWMCGSSIRSKAEWHHEQKTLLWQSVYVLGINVNMTIYSFI